MSERVLYTIGYGAREMEDFLATFEPRSLLADLEEDARVVALFCVEGEPAACHRLLVAERLQQALGLEIEHIVP
ncbi:MAG: hypothetical protein R3248_08030 [Candidatus Promineifilaceae bacterium]|nr:hypothetical protein [Candidatus Promineifilaceae bacterium]